MSEMLLSELPEHAVCRVLRVGNSLIKPRLAGLGITEGAELVKLFSAPCGDPAAYSVRGTVVALRRCDAAKIVVAGARAWA